MEIFSVGKINLEMHRGVNKRENRKYLEENAQQKYSSDKSGQQHLWMNNYL